MKRTRLEQAINRLVRLLQEGESNEAKYQDYFEQNPIVFEVLGYTVAYPKPRLPLLDGGHLEPDFLVERPDNLYEIFELKTPQEKLVHEKRYRDKLYAKVDSYVSQTETYSEYFDDSGHRKLVQETLSLDVQKKPDVVLVVGTDEGVDKRLLHLLIRRRTGALRIVTYDDILSKLKFHHAALFGDSENLSGASWHAIVTLYDFDLGRPQYIFDAGDSLTKNRWSVYIDENKRIQFQILDRDGAKHLVSFRIGQRDSEFGVKLYICCEFGSSDDFSIMQILIDNRVVARRELASPIAVSKGLDFSRKTIASDIEGKNHGTFDMAGLAIYEIVLPFQQRCALSASIFETFFDPSSLEIGRERKPRVVLPNTEKYLFLGEPGELK